MCCILVLAPAFMPFAIAQTCLLKLTGHVEDADTKEKLQQATVILKELNKQLITDANGNFSFNGLCKGNYTVEVTHVHCNPFSEKVNLQKNQHLDIHLPHAKNTLDEVVVESKKELIVTSVKKELSGRLLQQNRAFGLAEALGKLSGVTILQTGSTISKPVIHGMHGSRILTINNGVRQEGQQWGNEHAPEIDPFIAGKLLVIKGVDELKYGSDAIAGVVLVEPRALLHEPGHRAELNSAYFSNNNQYTLSGIWEQQLKNWRNFTYRLQGTYKQGANTSTPNYRLNNTASEEKNFSITTQLRGKKYSTELFYSQFNTRLGIFTGAHIGNLSDLEKAINSAQPDPIFLNEQSYNIQRPSQQVAHQLIKSKTTVLFSHYKLNVLLAGQFNQRKEFDVVRSSANKKPQINLSIATFSSDVNLEHKGPRGFNGTIGINGIQQENSYSGRYIIPNYTSFTYGTYWIEKWKYQQWELQAGLRYDNKKIATNRLLNSGIIFDTYSFDFSTFASSFTAAYNITENWELNASVALASRAPYVNELLSNGIHHGTATYEEGNLNLKPERAANFFLNTRFANNNRTVNGEISIYRNNIRRFIYQQPVPAEPVLTIAGAFPKLVYKQTDATLTGADLNFTIKPMNVLEWNSRASLLYARNNTTRDWLILMPANRFNNELLYRFKKTTKISDAYVSAEWSHVTRQNRVPSAKNGKSDYKETPGQYNLLNAYASTTLPTKQFHITATLGVRNILNTAYREYLNSFRYFTDEIGRNITLTIKLNLENISHQ
jgi:iron complex outermembrane receptor protein